MDLDTALSAYDFSYPEELIAVSPASPRDSAKLLVYSRDKQEYTDAVFRDIGKHLPHNALLVRNTTKVIPARLAVTRPNGGASELLILRRDGDTITALVRGKIRPDDQLTGPDGSVFTVMEDQGKQWALHASISNTEWLTFLDTYGQTPLPPYIKNSPLSEQERRTEYQTVFAEEEGSVAAPTASLHFTDALLSSLEDKGIEFADVTLHVGLGTFAPLREEHFKEGRLHREEIEITEKSAAQINAAKQGDRPIIAIGTTAVRCLESSVEHGQIQPGRKETDLFIQEGFNFQLTDGLITNFHVPKSSLLMLVSAFAGRKEVLDLYHHAIEKRYRLFSFGDAMLIVQ